MAIEIRVPTLGESVTEATVGQWFKKPGDAVNVDEPLVELETDKVTVEVPAPASGVMGELAAQAGETVAVGALLGHLNEGAGGAKSAAPAQLKASGEESRSSRVQTNVSRKRRFGTSGTGRRRHATITSSAQGAR